jgi:signal transduction histidine kinase
MQEIHARYPDAPQSTRERWLVLLWGVLVLCLLGGSAWAAFQLTGPVPQAQQILLAWPLGLLLALVVGGWWGWSRWQGRPHANMSLDDNMTRHEAQPEPVSVPDVPAPAAMTPTEQELLRYAISHDLRAPLRVIDGFARILKEEEGPRMDRMSNDHLDRLLAAAGRMHTMIDAILEQAQLTQSAIERQRVDLTALAQQVSTELSASTAAVAELTAPTKAKPAAVSWLVAEGMVATGDPDMVRRILENLMGNAVKYSSKVAHPQVEVGMVQAADPTVYFVRDNGAGFDMQHAQKLFGLFQRLHSHKEFPGSGVGLAGVQIMVRRHGGRIWAEAQPGQGACFYFTLSESQRN